jgi:hypothetical protein
MKHILLVAAAMVIGVGAAAAGNDTKFDHGNPPGLKQGEKTGWGDDKTPPGWDKGEKQGWQGKYQPPGLQAKKDYEDKGDRDDDHHRDRD